MGSSQPTMCKLFPYWGNVLLTTSSVPWYITCSCQRSTALWKQHAPQLDVRLVVLPMSQHWIVVRIRCVCVCVCVCVFVLCVCVLCVCVYVCMCVHTGTCTYCVQHAQITVCMVHVYDLCSVRYLLDRYQS